jgi:hypothetical protein
MNSTPSTHLKPHDNETSSYACGSCYDHKGYGFTKRVSNNLKAFGSMVRGLNHFTGLSYGRGDLYAELKYLGIIMYMHSVKSYW